jgi:hypothetical protein
MREAKLKNGENAYSEITAKNPKKLTDSVGFKEICEECGLTDNLILKALVFDIKKKPKNRKGELELGAKIKGMLIERKELRISNLTEILDELSN